MKRFLLAVLSLVPLAAHAAPVPEVLGHVRSFVKISQTQGGFIGQLSDDDWFGRAITRLGDLDGNGTDDLAVGASQDDDGGLGRGAVWILFLQPDGSVLDTQKISDTEGGFTGVLDDVDLFGDAVAGIGDLDGDGLPDLAVGAGGDDDGGFDRGAVWILFLNPNGTVRTYQKISSTEGGFAGSLQNGDAFGRALSAIGDLDGDGVTDLAVGAPFTNGGGVGRGASWILFLHPGGTVSDQQEISDIAGGFGGVLADSDAFGSSLAPIGDLDGDGTVDLAVGSPWNQDGGNFDAGATWVLFLNDDGTVAGEQKISATAGGFTGTLEASSQFGSGVAPLGDLDCDGRPDLAVGADGIAGGGPSRGAMFDLFLDSDGTVRFHTKVGDASGGFTGVLDDFDYFGGEVAPLADLDGDGHPEVAVGAFGDDDGGPDRGAVWILFLDGPVCPPPLIFADGFESGDASAWSSSVP
ncbi:MAG: FG-GAP-like repeat-containing protein [Thermoanaerobaculia bacterium]